MGVLFSTLALLLTGCGGGGSGMSAAPPLPPPPPARKGKYFKHIVIMIQENRTFDNLFATFPGADGARVGKTHDGTLRLKESNLESTISPSNGYMAWKRDFHNGAMDGFDLVPVGKTTPGTYVYQYVNPTQIQSYWQLAHEYVLADHLFQTQGTGSFTAHQDLIAGGAFIDQQHSVIDFPNDSGGTWGCDAPHGTATTLITAAQ